MSEHRKLRLTTETDSIRWHEWSASTFARAARDFKPVLLALGPAWCRWTAEMDQVAYHDPEVVRLVQECFVAVRVDADRRPDVSERYTLRGWPTTAFLTSGGHILGGGTYLEPALLVRVLHQVVEAFATRGGEISAAAVGPAAYDGPVASDDVELDPAAGQWLELQLTACFDQTWAGFGAAAKRVHAPALLAVLLGDRGDAPVLQKEIVTRTLDAIATRGLADPVEGGFYRYCEQADWSAPQVEKVLTVNADLLELYLSAARVFDQPEYGERASATIRFIHETFADQDGGFFSSQRADPVYAALATREARLEHGSPSVDRTVYTDASARMASAYVMAASVLDDSSLLEFAAATVDRVLAATYERGRGVGHVASGVPDVRGLLTDQVAASEALLDLYEACGQEIYLDMPQELMAYCEHEMWEDRNGFRDRSRLPLPDTDGPIGLLQEPHHPFGLNCRAAGVLARLASQLEDARYRTLAVRTLASQTALYQQHGLDGAAYVLALSRIEAVD